MRRATIAFNGFRLSNWPLNANFSRSPIRVIALYSSGSQTAARRCRKEFRQANGMRCNVFSMLLCTHSHTFIINSSVKWELASLLWPLIDLGVIDPPARFGFAHIFGYTICVRVESGWASACADTRARAPRHALLLANLHRVCDCFRTHCMHLHFFGNVFVFVFEQVLEDKASQAKRRLLIIHLLRWLDGF